MNTRQTFWRILVPQMWVYALPGLGNLWMVLIKATPLLFSLGRRRHRLLGARTWRLQTARFTDYPAWRLDACGNFLALLVFYLAFTRVSEIVLDKLMRRLTRGPSHMGGEAQRKAA